MGAAIAALEQPCRILRAQARAGVHHFHRIGQQPHRHAALGRVLDRVADQVAQGHRQRRFGRIDHAAALAFHAQLDGLAAKLGAVRVEQLLHHARDIGTAMAALVAREQQQRADQVGALLFGTLDAQQALMDLLVQPRLAEQQLGGAADHRQRRAQLVADVGVELAVALHHFGEPRRIIVERLGQLADLVVLGEMRRQRLGVLAPAIRPQAPGQVGHRLHHLGRRPPANQQRQAAEQQHRHQQPELQLLFAAGGLAHVVGNEKPCIRRLAHADLVGERLAVGRRADHAVDAVGQVLPLREIPPQAVQLVRSVQEGTHLLHRRDHVATAAGHVALP